MRKKYFVLTAILLVGVVLLSGCIGGDDEIEEVINNTEAEITLQNAMTELGALNPDQAKKYFANDFVFKGYEYGWYEEDLDSFVNASQNGTQFTTEIENFVEISENVFRANLSINYPDKTRYSHFEIKYTVQNDLYLISEIKDVLPQEEIDFLNTLATTFDSHDTLDEFLTYFGVSPNISVYGDNISDPTTLYNDFIASQEIDNAEFEFGGYWIENPEKVSIYGDLILSHSDGTSTFDYIDVEIEYNNGLKITDLKIN